MDLPHSPVLPMTLPQEENSEKSSAVVVAILAVRDGEDDVDTAEDDAEVDCEVVVLLV